MPASPVQSLPRAKRAPASAAAVQPQLETAERLSTAASDTRAVLSSPSSSALQQATPRRVRVQGQRCPSLSLRGLQPLHRVHLRDSKPLRVRGWRRRMHLRRRHGVVAQLAHPILNAAASGTDVVLLRLSPAEMKKRIPERQSHGLV